MSRFRFTVRRMMVAVAVAAGGLVLYLYVREKSEPLARGYQSMANEHAIRVYQLATWPVENTPEKKARTRAGIAHHSALESKYQRAARYPWLPVAPDPTEPE